MWGRNCQFEELKSAQASLLCFCSDKYETETQEVPLFIQSAHATLSKPDEPVTVDSSRRHHLWGFLTLKGRFGVSVTDVADCFILHNYNSDILVILTNN